MVQQEVESAKPYVVVAGTLPPPTTGMTLLTQGVVHGLEAVGSIRLLNWSSTYKHGSWKFRAHRLLRVINSFVLLLFEGRAGKGQSLYLVCNSNAGLYLTAAYVWFARRWGYPVYLHHHVYSYIDQFDRRMRWIDRCLEGSGGHVVHHQQMIDDFCSQYKSRCDFFVVLPSIASLPLLQARSQAHCPFRLGHMSNLTLAKGLQEVADTFNKLCEEGREVTLDLAGPAKGGAKQLLEAMLISHPDKVRYLGPVYGEGKVRFFTEIDAFILPTHSESWGIVLNESLAAGVPVITYNRGCTSVVVGESAGRVISPEADFVALASKQICDWIDRPEEYVAASQAAIEQAAFLEQEGNRTLREFAEYMFSAPNLKA